MATASLTDATVRSLETDQTQETWWDEKLTGFGIRVSGKTGRKSFVLRYRANGTRRRVTLGTYPDLSLADARQKAKAFKYDVALGNDPIAEQEEEEARSTFGELADLYLDRYADRKLSDGVADQYSRMIERDLRPALGELNADEVGREEVHDVLDSIVDRGAPIMANRTRTALSSIFEFGKDRGVVDANPAQGVRPPADENERDTVLGPDQIRAVWSALEPERPWTAAIFKLRLLTAQRGTEIRKMRRDDVDGRWWTLRAQETKANRRHRIYLTDPTVKILSRLPHHDKWMIPSPVGGHLSQRDKALRRIRDRTNFYWQARDLRRTAATHMRRLGVPRLHVAKLLNHRVPGVTGVYDRSSYDDEKREALERWADRLGEIVRGDADG